MVMKPPTVTAQEKRWRCQNGKPVAYDDKRLLAAREKLRANLLRYIAPDTEPYDKAVELVVKWCFPLHRGMVTVSGMLKSRIRIICRRC